jgi:cytochrome c553
MKNTLLLSALAITLSVPAMAGDPVAGQQKAGACIVCHGTTGFPGIFYTYQLAGRNADKLPSRPTSTAPARSCTRS